MSGSATKRLASCEVALLRGGPRAAVAVAALALHLRGAVAGRGGTMRTSGPSGGVGHPLPPLHPLEKAVHTSLYRPADLRELMERPRMHRELAELRTELIAQGLLRRCPPRRKPATRRLLADLREQLPLSLPLPDDAPENLPADQLVLLVALDGPAALLAVAPRFARQAGLVGRGCRADKGLLPQSWGGGRGLSGHSTDDGFGPTGSGWI